MWCVGRALALLGLVLAIGGAARAGAYPDHPVRIIVPFPPGGATYVAPLLLAKYFSETFGQNFLLDPRPGGGTIIGAAAAASAKPDGYTLFAASSSTMAANPNLYAGRLPYDPEHAFDPIGLIARFPFFVCVPSSAPAHSLTDLLAQAKAAPGRLSYGSNGNGTVGHIAMEMLKRATGTELFHVPYKSYTIALPDLLNGQLSTMMCDLSVTGSALRAGELRALAATTAERSRFLPDIPTVAESGFPGFDVSVWLGLFAPAGTSPEIIAALNRAMGAYLTTEQARNDYEALGQEPETASPTALRALIRADTEKYGAVIRAAKITVD